jgi:exosome complex component RRP4
MQSVVIPGQVIVSGEEGFLRGHGSYIQHGVDANGEVNNILVASVAGQIERVNKLITVQPLKSRYLGEVGDLVVGRITGVEGKRWKVDINGQRDAILQLSSVNLPDGEQRMRTHEDQMQMRSLFEEHDLISAEIQNVGADGQISIHTRSLKYGKLENGQVVNVPSSLIKRLPQHYITFHFGVDIILGRNGMIWITRSLPEEWKAQEVESHGVAPLAETLQHLSQRHARTPLLDTERLKVARVCNSIKVLCKHNVQLDVSSISGVYEKSVELNLSCQEMFLFEHQKILLADQRMDEE